MKTYSLTDVHNKHGEVFDHASHDPVILTKQERPSYVILSFRCYQQLLDSYEVKIPNLETQKAMEEMRTSKDLKSYSQQEFHALLDAQ